MIGASILPRVDLVRPLDEPTLAAVIAALDADLEGLAEDAQHAVVGVKRLVHDGRDEALGVVLDEGLLEHTLSAGPSPN
ncbi:MAG: hypothetical protein U0353_06975 [Sandaracinus sp.]